MKIETMIARLQALQELFPKADLYFTVADGYSGCEIEFQTFNIDDENSNIEVLFTTEN